MEIHYQWHITQIVRDIPRSYEFPTTLVAGILREVFSIDKKVSPILDNMKCLRRTHDGSVVDGVTVETLTYILKELSLGKSATIV